MDHGSHAMDHNIQAMDHKDATVRSWCTWWSTVNPKL
jgi:hypothetical protein